MYPYFCCEILKHKCIIFVLCTYRSFCVYVRTFYERCLPVCILTISYTYGVPYFANYSPYNIVNIPQTKWLEWYRIYNFGVIVKRKPLSII